MGRGWRGIIIPTAMFVAMFVLLLCTVLIATVSYNLSLSLGSVETTECRYLSFGATNLLISDLNAGLDAGTFTRERPRRVTDRGRIVESWVEPLADDPRTILVVARTYRSGGKPEVVKRLSSFREHTLARVYTNATDQDVTRPDPIYFSELSESGAWSVLPNVPKMRYTDAGVLQAVPGEVAGSIPYITGSPDGSLYALYVPVMDGWQDKPTLIFILPIKQGELALRTIVTGGRQGMTIGDLQPILQVLIDYASEVTLSKGVVPLKYSHEDNTWTALPPIPNVQIVGGKAQIEPGNFHLNGVGGPPVAWDGGEASAIYLKGQDAILQITEGAEGWEAITPPGGDITLLAADHGGTLYTQTASLQRVGIGYLLNILLGNLTGIYANTPTSALHKYEDGRWTAIPDPPARFYNDAGQLVDSPYPGTRGPTLGGMVGGEPGQVVVVSRPSQSGLSDTLYRYSDGVWEAVPSPPNTYYDGTGAQVNGGGLPKRLELGVGPEGNLIVRIPSDRGSDAIYLQTDLGEAGWELLPPVHGEGGQFVQTLSQMAVGQKKDGSGRGSFVVKATYF